MTDAERITALRQGAHDEDCDCPEWEKVREDGITQSRLVCEVCLFRLIFELVKLTRQEAEAQGRLDGIKESAMKADRYADTIKGESFMRELLRQMGHDTANAIRTLRRHGKEPG